MTTDPTQSPDAGLPCLQPCLSPSAADLFTALGSDGEQRSAFNLLFGTAIAASDALSAEDTAVLEEVAGRPGFDRTAFVAVLPRAAALLSALQADALLREAFNLLFDAALPETGGPPGSDMGKLFDVSGDPWYDETAFLTILPKASALYAALLADPVKRERYNALRGTAISATEPILPQDRGNLFDLTGDPKFDLTAFLAWL